MDSLHITEPIFFSNVIGFLLKSSNRINKWMWLYFSSISSLSLLLEVNYRRRCGFFSEISWSITNERWIRGKISPTVSCVCFRVSTATQLRHTCGKWIANTTCLPSRDTKLHFTGACSVKWTQPTDKVEGEKTNRRGVQMLFYLETISEPRVKKPLMLLYTKPFKNKLGSRKNYYCHWQENFWTNSVALGSILGPFLYYYYYSYDVGARSKTSKYTIQILLYFIFRRNKKIKTKINYISR